MTNYIRHLKAFYIQVKKDDRLRANHVSLYSALFQVWNHFHFQNPFPIVRKEVIGMCKIGSRSTYVQCLKDLHNFLYIIYQPGIKPYESSLITINKLTGFSERKAVQLSLFQDEFAPGLRPKIEPQTGAKNEPRIGPILGHNYNKQLNNINEGEKNTPSPQKHSVLKSENTSRKKKEKKHRAPPLINPALDAVQALFEKYGYPPREALKFFYHYQANDWKQGGKTPMKDWQPAAHKWVLNIQPPKTENNDTRASKPGRLHSEEDKSYSDPL